MTGLEWDPSIWTQKSYSFNQSIYISLRTRFPRASQFYIFWPINYQTAPEVDIWTATWHLNCIFQTVPYTESTFLQKSFVRLQALVLGVENVVCCLISYVRLCDPMDYSPPGSSVHGISQTRILEWVVSSFSRGSSWPRDRIFISCIAGRFFTAEPPCIYIYISIHSSILVWEIPWTEQPEGLQFIGSQELDTT